jgi:ankyrin repeat protein
MTVTRALKSIEPQPLVGVTLGNGWSLLIWAAASGHQDVVQLLLDNGNVNVGS